MEAPIPSEMEAPGLGLPPQKKIGGAAAATGGPLGPPPPSGARVKTEQVLVGLSDE